MDTELDPVVGNWYRNSDKGQLFRVVAYDEERGIIKLQHFDGDLEKIDASDWFDMEIEPAETPEEWTGPVAHGEADDLSHREAPTLEKSGTEVEKWDDDDDEDPEDEDDWDDSGSDEDS